MNQSTLALTKRVHARGLNPTILFMCRPDCLSPVVVLPNVGRPFRFLTPIEKSVEALGQTFIRSNDSLGRPSMHTTTTKTPQGHT